jgi:acyl carrier protein
LEGEISVKTNSIEQLLLACGLIVTAPAFGQINTNEIQNADGCTIEQVLSTEDRVKEILHRHLGVDIRHIQPQTHLASLDIDSLDASALLIAFEMNFNVNVTDETAAKFQTVKDVIDYADEHGACEAKPI